MKTIKNVMKLFVFAIIILAATQVKAQGNDSMGKRREMAEQRFKEMSDRLALTPDQQNKMKVIAKQNRMEMKQLRETKKDAPKDEKKTAFMAQLKKADDQVNAILNPNQQELYKQYKAEKKAERERKMKEKHEEHELMGGDGLF